MTTSSKIIFVGPVRVAEHRYESGLIEVSFSVAEVISGAGPILSAVMTRREPGAKWRVAGRGFGNSAAFKSRPQATAWALDLAKKHEAELAHLR
jgi:hypothetical protein